MKTKSIPFVFLTLITVLLTACKTKLSNKQTVEIEKSGSIFLKTGSVDRLNPLIDKIIAPGELPEIITEGFEWSEGPLWLPGQEILIFSDIPLNCIYQWSEKGGLKLYLRPSGYTDSIPRGGETGSNGLLLTKDGMLVLCQHGDRRMAIMNAPLTGPKPDFKTLANRWEGKRFNSKMTAPNGIGLSPDESKLYVANSGEEYQASGVERQSSCKTKLILSFTRCLTPYA